MTNSLNKLEHNMSANLLTSMSVTMSAIDADRMEIGKYHGRTNRLTVVGARDACESNKKST